jgi:hypothetical protein
MARCPDKQIKTMDTIYNFNLRSARALDSKVESRHRLLSRQTGQRIATRMSLVNEAPPNCRPGFAQRLSHELKCSGSVPGDPRRKATSLKWSKRSRKDMSTSAFTVTLLLLGTIGATQTENPTFWLLIGPAPFAVVLAGLVFFRQAFSPRHRKTSALRPDYHPVNMCTRGTHSIGNHLSR